MCFSVMDEASPTFTHWIKPLLKQQLSFISLQPVLQVGFWSTTPSVTVSGSKYSGSTPRLCNESFPFHYCAWGLVARILCWLPMGAPVYWWRSHLFRLFGWPPREVARVKVCWHQKVKKVLKWSQVLENIIVRHVSMYRTHSSVTRWQETLNL